MIVKSIRKSIHAFIHTFMHAFIRGLLWAAAGAGALSSVLYGVDSRAESNAPVRATTNQPANQSAPLDSPLPKPLDLAPLDPMPNTLLPSTTPNPVSKSAPTHALQGRDQSRIDTGSLAHTSRSSYRYNTRFDGDHALEILGTGGEMGFMDTRGASSFYGGSVVKYDGLIDRYPLGAFLGYGYQGAISQSLAPTPTPTLTTKAQMISAQSLTLGIYSDVFFEEQHIQGFIAQSFQAVHGANTAESSSWLFTSATNAALSYGYVLAFGSSFLEPYARWNLHALYPMHDLTSDQQSFMSSYVLRSSVEIGVQYRQFMGRRVFFSLAPTFRQDIGVIGFGSLAHLIALDTQGQGIFVLPDSRYHSYAVLDLGLSYRASRACTLSLKAQGIYTHSFYSYGAQMGAVILF